MSDFMFNEVSENAGVHRDVSDYSIRHVYHPNKGEDDPLPGKF